MAEIHTTALSSGFCIRVLEDHPGFHKDIESRVRDLWESKIKATSKIMFDGPILSVVEHTSSVVYCVRTSYRYLLAQKNDASLAPILKIKPLAVSGLLESADGFVIGLRSAQMQDYSSCWEFIPSGGVEGSNYGPGTRVCFEDELLREFKEEVGFDLHGADLRAVGLFENAVTSTVDLGIYINARNNTAFDQLSAAHQATKKEYESLKCFGAGEMEDFIVNTSQSIVPESKALWAEFSKKD